MSGRDPALVNKDSDFLKEELLVPPKWRQDANRGMEQGPDGRWKHPERIRVEEHPVDIDHHLAQIRLPGRGRR